MASAVRAEKVKSDGARLRKLSTATAAELRGDAENRADYTSQSPSSRDRFRWMRFTSRRVASFVSLRFSVEVVTSRHLLEYYVYLSSPVVPLKLIMQPSGACIRRSRL